MLAKSHRLYFGVLCAAVILSSPEVASAQEMVSRSGKFQEISIQLDRLFQKKQWNRSENLLADILKSPRADERIFAAEKLAVLYKKMRRKKRALQMEEQVRQDKAFLERAVPQAEDFYEPYTVQKGDSYSKLALRYAVSEEWLIQANHSKKLRPEDVIKIPKWQDSIRVDTDEKKLFWMRGESLIKTYSVAVGKVESKTPEGDFLIAEKIEKPTWYIPGKIIPPESPKNLLGTRWLGLNQKGYGIHGTRYPYSIGKRASHGCIRLLNQDVEELFLWIPVGTKVKIEASPELSSPASPQV